RIRANALATLNRLSVLGAATIDISPGTVDNPVLADGATIAMRKTLSVDEMMEGISELMYASGDDRHRTLFDNLAQAAA
ncbi:hypothetical protein DF186_24440, partial [Enterococcus hirae]